MAWASDPLIRRLDQMTTSITQLLQLARVSQSYSQVSLASGIACLLDDVVRARRRTNWRLCWHWRPGRLLLTWYRKRGRRLWRCRH